MSKLPRHNGITIVGDKDVLDILDNIAPKESRNLIRATVFGIAQRVTKGAKQRVPKDTGVLRKSIYTKREKSHPDRPASSVRFRERAYYWRFVEYGTQRGNNINARPFLGPAKHQVMGNLKGIAREEFQKKLTSRINRLLRQQARKNGVRS